VINAGQPSLQVLPQRTTTRAGRRIEAAAVWSRVYVLLTGLR